MYAIVEIAGQQFKVEKEKKIFVHRLKANIGDVVNFDKVLLLGQENSVVVGTPTISGAVISAKVLDHVKGDKVLVFKKKRRKGYQKMNGHRQYFTQIAVEDILTNDARKSADLKSEVKKDDLKIIEGIGPKIAELLNNAGIYSFADLAAANPDLIKDVLEKAGSRFAVHNPSTWPKQSQLAAEGKWDELKELQENLKGGVE